MIKKMIASALLLTVTVLPAHALKLKDLEKGKIDIQWVEKKTNPFIQTRGMFNVPVQKAWKTLTDFNNYPKYYESVTQTTVRKTSGNKSTVYVEFKFPWPIGKVWVLNEYTLNSTSKTLSWKMLDGNLKDTDGNGSWKLKPYKKKTIATYKLNMKSGGATQWVKKQALYRSIPGIFSKLNYEMR